MTTQKLISTISGLVVGCLAALFFCLCVIAGYQFCEWIIEAWPTFNLTGKFFFVTVIVGTIAGGVYGYRNAGDADAGAGHF